MALSSQMSRTGLSRRYMGGSARNRNRRWPWVMVFLCIAAGVGVVQWLSDSEAQVTVPGEAASTAASPAAASSAGPSAAPSTPANAAPAAPAKPAVPSFTLGGTEVATPQPTAAKPVAATTPAAAVVEAAPPAPSVAHYDASRTSSASAATVLSQGMNLIADGRFIEGRRMLSELLFARAEELSPADAQTVRDTLASINKEMVFSPKVFPGDPLAVAYRVEQGEYLSKIAYRHHVPYPFLEMINKIDARRLQAGQTIKVIKGPFHARVIKSEYRMDLYLKEDSGTPIYVMSLPVGLGEGNSTPVGAWIVEEGRKVKNPAWSNPRTSEFYAANDPANPIGEYWLALKGISPETEGLRGYGIHGTTDPDSIGNQRSMGCVRLRDADIELVFKMLEDGHSTVDIIP